MFIYFFIVHSIHVTFMYLTKTYNKLCPLGHLYPVSNFVWSPSTTVMQ